MKNFYLFCTLLLASLPSIAQSFTVQIHVPASIPLDKLVISYGDGFNNTDLKHGDITHSIVLKGDLHTLYGDLFIAIQGDHMMFTSHENYFFGPGNSEITLKDSSLQATKLVNIVNAKAKGKKEYDQYTAQENEAVRKMMLEFNSATEYTQALIDKARNSQIALDRKSLEFVYKNPTNYFSFHQFHGSFTSLQQFVPIDSLIKAFDRFPAQFKNTEEGRKLYKEMTGLNDVRNKQIAADFQLQDIHGNKISLANFKGNYVILDFWATWCGPCMEAMPKLVDFSNKYPAVKVISISSDRDSTAYNKVVDTLPASWAHIYHDDTVGNMYGVVGIPQLFLISPDGKMVLHKIGGDAIANFEDIEKVLKATAVN